jgi:hypothetical protein
LYVMIYTVNSIATKQLFDKFVPEWRFREKLDGRKRGQRTDKVRSILKYTSKSDTKLLKLSYERLRIRLLNRKLSYSVVHSENICVHSKDTICAKTLYCYNSNTSCT